MSRVPTRDSKGNRVKILFVSYLIDSHVLDVYLLILNLIFIMYFEKTKDFYGIVYKYPFRGKITFNS